MTKHWFIAHLIKKYTKGKHFGLDVGIGNDNWSEFTILKRKQNDYRKKISLRSWFYQRSKLYERSLIIYLEFLKCR